MPGLSTILPLLSILIALGAAVGVVIAFLGNRNRGLSEVQNSTISSLQATIQSLQAQNVAQEKQMQAQNVEQEKQMQALEKKIIRMEGVLHTIQYTLKERRRLKLEVKDDFVLLLDERTGAEITVPIRLTTGPLEKNNKEA